MEQMVNQISTSNWQNVLDSLCSPMDDSILFKIFHEVLMNQLVEGNETSRMVGFCLSDKLNRSCLEKWLSVNLKKYCTTKSASESKRFRELGNEVFKSGADRKSLEFYSKSVCLAPFKSEEFPLALANRSAALFRLQLFKECLQDVDLALKNGYPKNLRHKLLLRKGKLLLTWKKCKQALDVFKEAEKCWPPKEKKNSVIFDDLIKSKEIAREGIAFNLQNLSSDDEIVEPFPTVRKGESTTLKHMSAALDLKVTEEKGRHIVANTDINAGDILFVEKPYAFVVLPIAYDTNGHNFCHNCCTDVFAPIPCQSCVTAMYCSEACCKAAWDRFHRWECGGLDFFHLVGIAHLGLRVTLISNCEESAAAGPGPGSGTDYEMVKSLVSHIHEMDRKDLYQYALTASLLALFLQQKGYYSATKHEMTAVGGQIMLHICQLTCNGHAITKFVQQTMEYEGMPGMEVSAGERAATAIYPSASMMNHSCQPNIINSFYNEHLVVRAMCNIPRGSEVLNCYGPHYLRMNAKERRKCLREQYYFECECQHCRDGVKAEALATFTALLCAKCAGPLVPANIKVGICAHCKNKASITELTSHLTEADKLYDQGITSLEAGNAADAISNLLKCLPLLESSVYKYNKRLRECKDALSKGFSILNNYTESRKYLEECIPVVEKQFGEKSIEVGNEYVKLMTIYLTEAELCKNKKLKK
ncbi:SET and MYND domain-containing protein 4 isoform X2 [Nilaparvata lugens]|nr:SET and MYND domain-containing protein 4 isoform X2 [Nilaparvata lugens]